jgi:hypothetical protein
MSSAISFVVIFTLFLSVSCVSKPNRPDAPLCLRNTDAWMCTDSSGDFEQEEDELICTDFAGYADLEGYIDSLELRIRKLERRCKIP